MYRPCILNVEKPPCVKNGVKCDKRHIGCQGTCEDYIKFRSERDKKLVEARKINGVQTSLHEYNIKGRLKAFKKKRKR